MDEFWGWVFAISIFVIGLGSFITTKMYSSPYDDYYDDYYQQELEKIQKEQQQQEYYEQLYQNQLRQQELDYQRNSYEQDYYDSYSDDYYDDYYDNYYREQLEDIYRDELYDSYDYDYYPEIPLEEETTPTPTKIVVTNIVDGDTLDISTGERVRLICIDTPENGDYYYQEATDYLESLVLNKEVELVKDISEMDKYDRLLRYIYVDDLFVNKEMVEKGYAKAYPYEPDTSKCPEIEDAETSARENKIGIWDEDVPDTINCNSNAYNCGDFSTCTEVMEVFDTCSTDIHLLDADGDGVPCESLCL